MARQRIGGKAGAETLDGFARGESTHGQNLGTPYGLVHIGLPKMGYSSVSWKPLAVIAKAVTLPVYHANDGELMDD
jgi:hypothetical protein